MRNLVDAYVALDEQEKKISKAKAEIKRQLLAAYRARPHDDPNAKRLAGTDHCVTVVTALRRTFDRAKFEAKHGAIHPAYFKETVTESLKIGGLQ